MHELVATQQYLKKTAVLSVLTTYHLHYLSNYSSNINYYYYYYYYYYCYCYYSPLSPRPHRVLRSYGQYVGKTSI